MIINRVNHYKMSMLGGIFLIVLGTAFPFMTQDAWFNIIFKIRDAINAGDSGHLILASASMSLLYAVQSTSLFLGVILVAYYSKLKSRFSEYKISTITLAAVILLHIANSFILDTPWEPVPTILSVIISLFIFEKLLWERSNVFQVAIVSIQVFFAFQWLNIMPIFSPYYIGQGDIPVSIKMAGLYLQAASVLNFTGFAFFLPFILFAFITAVLFISYAQNINIMKENYSKENQIQYMKRKIMEDRIYKEVNSLVHDLKTPLVTIRGLNSLLALSKDENKLMEYSERIENSVDKMSEMISSFLYEASRQKLRAADLISYVRAQLPLEDDTIKIDINISDGLPYIYVNKIRVARAVINILENAIVAPCSKPFKHIIFEAKPTQEGLNIIVQDNGVGIKESDLARIWEVGFSTNRTSGLGLPFAKQIIEDNGGSINIMSRPDSGTVATIFLPSKEDE